MVSGTITAGPKKNYFLLVFVAAFLAIALIIGNTTWSLAQVQQQFPESIIAASSSDTTPHALNLKATQQGEDGQPKRVSGFKIDLTNVVTAQINSQVLVFATDSSLQVTGAKIRSVSGQLIDLIPSTGQTNAFSLAGLPVGVYTLDIITQKGNTKAAYEGVLVISQLPTTVFNETTKNVINQEINQKSTETNTKVIFKEKDDDKDDKDKDDGNPYCDLIDRRSYKGSCHDRKDYYDGGPNNGLYPCRDGSNVKDWRDCDDAGDHPDEKDPEDTGDDNPRDDPDCWYGDLYVCDENGECDTDNIDCITDCADGSSVTTGEECPGDDNSDAPSEEEDNRDGNELPDCSPSTIYQPCKDTDDDSEDTGGSNPRGEEEDQNCGGEPCTDDEKEDSTLDEPEYYENNDGALGDPIEEEEEIEEIEETGAAEEDEEDTEEEDTDEEDTDEEDTDEEDALYG